MRSVHTVGERLRENLHVHHRESLRRTVLLQQNHTLGYSEYVDSMQGNISKIKMQCEHVYSVITCLDEQASIGAPAKGSFLTKIRCRDIAKSVSGKKKQ